MSATTTSRSAPVFTDQAPAPQKGDWRRATIVVWSAILVGCTVFWAGVVAVLLAL